jgi:hypothetical protein
MVMIRDVTGGARRTDSFPEEYYCQREFPGQASLIDYQR